MLIAGYHALVYVLAIACLGCAKKYEVDEVGPATVTVVENGRLRQLKPVAFSEVGVLRVRAGGFFFEDCPQGQEPFAGEPPCWPGERMDVSSSQIRRLLNTMPPYRDPDVLDVMARRYPADDRIRVVLGTQPLIVGIESRRARGTPGFAYVAREDALHLRIVALVVWPDFGGVEEPVLVEFREPMVIAEVLDQLAAGAEWSSFGEARALPGAPRPSTKPS